MDASSLWFRVESWAALHHTAVHRPLVPEQELQGGLRTTALFAVKSAHEGRPICHMAPTASDFGRVTNMTTRAVEL